MSANPLVRPHRQMDWVAPWTPRTPLSRTDSTRSRAVRLRQSAGRSDVRYRGRRGGPDLREIQLFRPLSRRIRVGGRDVLQLRGPLSDAPDRVV